MEQTKSRVRNWIRNSITARMLIVGFLLIILLLPLQYVKSLISERSTRQKEVVQEINSKWGNNIILSGPILKVPYKSYTEERSFNEETKKYITKTITNTNYAFVFPDVLDINSNVDTKPLNRSIYKSVVYTADITIKGNFPEINLKEYDIQNEDIIWDKISVLVKTSNLKGIRNTPKISMDSSLLAMTPRYDREYLNTIESEFIKEFSLEKNKAIPFSIDLKINGSELLEFIPIGKETTAAMSSNWHSPSFDGKYLPEDGSREITDNGFSASWKVLQINRQFEQIFLKSIPNLREFKFGTKLIIPVDEYQKSERTAKYGFMVIGLTLLVFLLIQLVSKIHIHPFQYVMIGLALVMFYTLLISISEHSSFLKAYIVAAFSVLTLIVLYSRAILSGFKFPLLIGASLASLYGFIYVIIQLENYALLVGSIGLFIILGVVMFTSRKIDWGNN